MDSHTSKLNREWDAASSSFKKPCRMLLIGLQNAGKTTILKAWNLDELAKTTLVDNVEVKSIEYKNLNITMLDVPDQGAESDALKALSVNTQAVVFVVDGNDTHNFAKASKALHKAMASDEMSNDAVLMVFVNKQDLPNVPAVMKVASELKIRDLPTKRWYIQATCALVGHGLIDGLQWLANTLNRVE